MGQVKHIFIASEHRAKVAEIDNAVLEAGKGIVGDRYHSQAQVLMSNGQSVPENHLSLVAIEQLQDYLEAQGCEIPLGDFRRSIVTSGIDLNLLEGKTFKVGDATCFGIELCEPCAFLAATVHRGVLPGLVKKAGLRATIVESGAITHGSEIYEI